LSLNMATPGLYPARDNAAPDAGPAPGKESRDRGFATGRRPTVR
jgi:hypothetical protein